MIIHPNFKPGSPLQSFLESSSPKQSTSDTCVSEGLAHVVEPINVAKLVESFEPETHSLPNLESV